MSDPTGAGSVILLVSGKGEMRRRVLFIALVVVTLATVAVTFWSPHTSRYHYRRSSSLALSLLARTNGNVLVVLQNSGGQQFEISGEVSIEYLNPASPEDYIVEDFHSFTNSRFTLGPGAAFQACFPAPTKHLKWRAHIGGVSGREVAFKYCIR
ncbi:MAG TPA: hypothetical protein VEC99_05950, partial [Clostridia bacterium]|nr:hypothetical protein [Clostridia bacterium]